MQVGRCAALRTTALGLLAAGAIVGCKTPTVETPTVETPTVETPTVETPTVETPTVETPTVETPTVETPARCESDMGGCLMVGQRGADSMRAIGTGCVQPDGQGVSLTLVVASRATTLTTPEGRACTF